MHPKSWHCQKGEGGVGFCPLPGFFWRIWQCFPSQFLDNLTKTTGVLYGRGSAPCQDFLGGFGSHYKICCENFEALFQANQYANAVCVNIKTLSLPSKCSLSTKTYLTKWPIKSTKVQLSDDYCTLYCINTV